MGTIPFRELRTYHSVRTLPPVPPACMHAKDITVSAVCDTRVVLFFFFSPPVTLAWRPVYVFVHHAAHPPTGWFLQLGNSATYRCCTISYLRSILRLKGLFLSVFYFSIYFSLSACCCGVQIADSRLSCFGTASTNEKCGLV